MTQTPNNIFDLLLGNFAAPASRPGVSVGQTADSSGALFVDIINSYLGQATGSKVLGESSGITAPVAGRTDREAKLLFEAFMQSPVVESGDAEIVAEVDTVDETNTGLAKELLASLPMPSVSLGQNIKNIRTETPVEIKPSKYEVIDSNLVDGQLNLELVSKDNPGTTIKVSISAELLSRNAETNTPSVPGQARVELDGYAYDKARFESLLSGVNVKEIEIKGTSDINNPVNINEPLQITLVAESSSGELVLRNKLNRSQLKIEAPAMTLPTVDDNQTEINLPSDKTAQQLSVRLSQRSEPAASKAAVLDDTGFWSQQIENSAESKTAAKTFAQLDNGELPGKSDIFEEFGFPVKKISTSESKDGVEGFFGFDKNVSEKTGSSRTQNSAPVRFSLPDNIKTALKPNGSSVTINIEPEQLGPAKLSLSFHNDQLRARVTVHSEAARTTVESNVDKLMTQLSKANIKVEFIEVSVSGDGAHNQFLGQQRQWRQKMASRSLGSDKFGLGAHNIAVTPTQTLATQYAGGGGVNLLA